MQRENHNRRFDSRTGQACLAISLATVRRGTFGSPSRYFALTASVSCPSSSPVIQRNRKLLTVVTVLRSVQAPAVCIEIAPHVSRSIAHRCIRPVSLHCNTARYSLMLNSDRERKREGVHIHLWDLAISSHLGLFNQPRVFVYLSSRSIAFIVSPM